MRRDGAEWKCWREIYIYCATVFLPLDRNEQHWIGKELLRHHTNWYCLTSFPRYPKNLQPQSLTPSLGSHPVLPLPFSLLSSRTSISCTTVQVEPLLAQEQTRPPSLTHLFLRSFIIIPFVLYSESWCTLVCFAWQHRTSPIIVLRRIGVSLFSKEVPTALTNLNLPSASWSQRLALCL